MDEAMQRRQVLIVDGYNVIRNNDRYAYLGIDYESGEGWNKARETLINDAAQLAQEHYERCTVVFDAAGNPDSTGAPVRKAGIDVVFSPAGVSADSVIERLAHDARESGFEVVVVSSDFTIQATVFGGGVASLSSLAFTADRRSDVGSPVRPRAKSAPSPTGSMPRRAPSSRPWCAVSADEESPLSRATPHPRIKCDTLPDAVLPAWRNGSAAVL